MLGKFKSHAKEQMMKRQKKIDGLMAQINKHNDKIMRLTGRIREKKLKGFLSDDEEEEEPAIDVTEDSRGPATLEELQVHKAKRA